MSSLAKPGAAAWALTVLFTVALGCREASPPGATTGSGAPKSDSDATSGFPLTLGSPAPPLSIAQWITGQPIERFEPGRVYVVEFWATWCGPCRQSMPHLSQLQQQHGDEVEFVGITREPEITVREFLETEQSPDKTWAQVVQYRLAIDSADATNKAYMEAAGQSGIPAAFIVGRDAVVEWIGHPMSIDDPLARILAGTWDRQAAIADFQQKQKLAQLSREVNAHLRAEKWDDALAMIDRFERESGLSSQLARTRLSVLQKAGRGEEAAKLQAELVEQSWDDAMVLNEIAWDIATSQRKAELELALKAAQRASEIQNHEDANILDTVARIYYETDQLDQAVQWQKKAVEHNQGNRSIDATLKMYEAEQTLKDSDLTPPNEDNPAKAEEQPPANN